MIDESVDYAASEIPPVTHSAERRGVTPPYFSGMGTLTSISPTGDRSC